MDIFTEYVHLSLFYRHNNEEEFEVIDELTCPNTAAGELAPKCSNLQIYFEVNGESNSGNSLRK